MKRIFTISVAAVMALLMVLSLTACGNSTLGLSLIHISEPTRPY